MKNSLMIDIETLAVSPSATILTIGAQGFNPYDDGFNDTTYYQRINLECQSQRDIDESTVEWWGKQAEDVQNEALGDGPDRVDLKIALEDLSKIIWKADTVWSQGSFDFVILENAFKSYGINLPWQYYKVRDCRTILSLAPKLGKLENSHNALEDCINQIDALQKTFKHLNITAP